MRDLVPRKSPGKKKLVTPWSTFVHHTPTKVVAKKRAKSISPSPVAHSKDPMPPSPFVFSPVREEDRCTPSIDLFPHESVQLPKRTIDGIRRDPSAQRSPIDIIEEFIADLSPEDKEQVRSTYNGLDWHKRPLKTSLPLPCIVNQPSRGSVVAGKQAEQTPTAATMQSRQYRLPPPTLMSNQFAMSMAYQPQHVNRFLVGLPVPMHRPQPVVVHQYFPRGC